MALANLESSESSRVFADLSEEDYCSVAESSLLRASFEPTYPRTGDGRRRPGVSSGSRRAGLKPSRRKLNEKHPALQIQLHSEDNADMAGLLVAQMPVRCAMAPSSVLHLGKTRRAAWTILSHSHRPRPAATRTPKGVAVKPAHHIRSTASRQPAV